MKTKLRILSVIALVVFFGGKTLVAQEPDFLFEHPYPYPVPDDFMTSGYLGEMPYTTSLEMGSGEGYLIAMSASINANLMETDTVARPPVVYKVPFCLHIPFVRRPRRQQMLSCRRIHP